MTERKQNRVKMQSAYFLLIILIMTGPTAAFDLDSLLSRSIGGAEAVALLEQINSVVTTGSVTLAGQEGRFTQYFLAPDRLYLKVDFDLFSLVQAYDGRTAWQQDLSGRFTELTGFEKRELLKTVYFESFSYLFPKRVPGSYRYLGRKMLDSTVFHEVAFITADIDTVVASYDEPTGLKRLIKTRMDGLEVNTTISDYRNVSGVEMPFHSRAVARQAGLVAEFVVAEILFNEDIDVSLFSMPSTGGRSFNFPDSVTTLTIPFDYSRGHIRLPVVVNGKKRAWFILDSGASTTIFHEPFAAGMELEPAGALSALGLGGYEEIELYRTDSLTVGDLTLYEQICGVIDLGGLALRGPDGAEFGGLLGYDFLSRFPTMVNYSDSTLTLFHPDRFLPPDSGVEVGFDLTMQVPTVEAELAGVEGDYLIDLGNAFGLILHHKYVEKAELIGRLALIEENSPGISGIGGILSGRTALADRFRIGEIVIDSLRVILPDSALGMAGSRELAGNIGNLVLENFTILFDYTSQRLIFYPADKPIPPVKGK